MSQQAMRKAPLYNEEEVAALAAYVASLAPGPAALTNEEITWERDGNTADGGEPPHYTASIDAVFDLVDAILPGAQIEVTNIGYATVRPASGPKFGQSFAASNKTETRPTVPLAALSALLRAYAESGSATARDESGSAQ